MSGDLTDVARRLRGLEPWWRPSESGRIRQCLEEADALPERQAQAREAQRAAQDELAKLRPDGTPATQARWRELQGTLTAQARVLRELDTEESALLAALSVELWWARTTAWNEGVARINAMEATQH
ncbi:hypothetical protein [Myxococcus virescens]|uniref:Uncharacterized protein n=1 Tax=Myxococcus virescens TaxID=83456 RepID=A0A511HJ88_9BACT|nr:hypothetical protein [Myxococcus virescens]GEL73651.1 hypothetical protein MVI01_54350 [Myxococcus virescens]SDE53521.1 hypothetical protein SAMN04488504_10898 [Myxococcus virescens]